MTGYQFIDPHMYVPTCLQFQWCAILYVSLFSNCFDDMEYKMYLRMSKKRF